MSQSTRVYVANVFTLKDASAIETVLDLVKKGVQSTSSKNPGYVADTVFRSLDGKAVMNFSVWDGGAEQLGKNHQANEANPSYKAQMDELAKYASMTPSAYTIAFEHNGGLAAAAEPEIGEADLRRWIDTWNTHDIAAILDLFADDVVMHQPQNPKPLDKEALGKFFGGMFQSYKDIRFELEGHTINGRDVASWEIVTGTMTGPFQDPSTGKTVHPTGKSFSIPGAIHLKYGDNHKIKEVQIYWDRLLLNQQLGLM